MQFKCVQSTGKYTKGATYDVPDDSHEAAFMARSSAFKRLILLAS